MIPEIRTNKELRDGEEKSSDEEEEKKAEEDPLASMSPAERQRYEMAQNLSMALGLDNVELCIRALKTHDDDPNVTAEWLMTSPVEVDNLRQEIEAEKLAILSPGESSKDGDDELDDDIVEERERQAAADLLKKAKEREEQARNLVDIYGVPFKLAYAALELHNGDVNSAANWMLDAGMKFYGEDSLKTAGEEEKIDESLKNKIDDSAALEDIADVEPLVTDDSSEDGGKTVTRRRRIPECRVASLSALPYVMFLLRKYLYFFFSEINSQTHTHTQVRENRTGRGKQKTSHCTVEWSARHNVKCIQHEIVVLREWLFASSS